MWANNYRAALIAASLATLGALSSNGNMAQAQTLDQAMEDIADALHAFLGPKGITRVAVGRFEGPKPAKPGGDARWRLKFSVVGRAERPDLRAR